MRQFILIAGLVLASATAQAEPRSLSLAGSDVLAAPAPAKAADAPKAAEAPQAVEAPKADDKAEGPKYIERPAAVAPKAETPKVEQTTTEPARPVKSARTEKRRHQRYWTEGRIIGELHRHGIYW